MPGAAARGVRSPSSTDPGTSTPRDRAALFSNRDYITQLRLDAFHGTGEFVGASAAVRHRVADMAAHLETQLLEGGSSAHRGPPSSAGGDGPSAQPVGSARRLSASSRRGTTPAFVAEADLVRPSGTAYSRSATKTSVANGPQSPPKQHQGTNNKGLATIVGPGGRTRAAPTPGTMAFVKHHRGQCVQTFVRLLKDMRHIATQLRTDVEPRWCYPPADTHVMDRPVTQLDLDAQSALLRQVREQLERTMVEAEDFAAESFTAAEKRLAGLDTHRLQSRHDRATKFQYGGGVPFEQHPRPSYLDDRYNVRSQRSEDSQDVYYDPTAVATTTPAAQRGKSEAPKEATTRGDEHHRQQTPTPGGVRSSTVTSQQSADGDPAAARDPPTADATAPAEVESCGSTTDEDVRLNESPVPIDQDESILFASVEPPTDHGAPSPKGTRDEKVNEENNNDTDEEEELRRRQSTLQPPNSQPKRNAARPPLPPTAASSSSGTKGAPVVVITKRSPKNQTDQLASPPAAPARAQSSATLGSNRQHQQPGPTRAQSSASLPIGGGQPRQNHQPATAQSAVAKSEPAPARRAQSTTSQPAAPPAPDRREQSSSSLIGGQQPPPAASRGATPPAAATSDAALGATATTTSGGGESVSRTPSATASVTPTAGQLRLRQLRQQRDSDSDSESD